MSDLQIRHLGREEISIAIEWAAAEGWNPGLRDAACFAIPDAKGFFVGEIDGEPVATVSCVNYDDRFAFLGFYIVRAGFRGRGHGLRIWNAAIAHAGSRVIGLDGVVAQQDNYSKSGFQLAYANIRYSGAVVTPPPPADLVALDAIPFALVEADDATVFPAPRAAFLRAWISTPGHVGRALMRDNKLAAWGVIRTCRTGRKIGPLVADDRAAADAIVQALLASPGSSEIVLDIPAVNREAIALAESLGLKPTFETARMYTGPVPSLRLDRVFGVTSFELG
ncbi:RimJ/RimL family protein N-acetyltransferase [Bradyrhizobium sp. S3.12.5]|uniref:GNAT family N-acetyltransferase n=1 Tax=Bradyrhizobium sp. S3.12.5 TaxID=3156386 RepID=UPI00339241BF